MSLFGFLKRKEASPDDDRSIPLLHAEIAQQGLVYRQGMPSVADARTVSIDAPSARPLLSQLLDDGYATESDGTVTLSWDAVYERSAAGVAGWNPEAIGCPSSRTIVPALVSRGSLTDPGFAIGVMGWRDERGAPVVPSQLVGAAVGWPDGLRLMPPAAWALVQRVRSFASRPEADRTADAQRRAWGEIRRLAIQSHAVLDDFLTRSVVITADRLNIGFRNAQVSGSKLVEVIPSVDNVPDEWLERFDRLAHVPDRYDLPTPDGIVQVIVAPEVRAVLEEIKRMPGRRVAGNRAERFLANPIAALGPEAGAAVDPEQVEAAKAEAGIESTTFLARIDRDEAGRIAAIGVDLTRCLPGEEPVSDALTFAGDDSVIGFIEGVRARLKAGLQYFGWDGLDIELVDGTEAQVDRLASALEERRLERVLIRAQDVYDLSHYSERIDGVGPEDRVYSPFIARKDEGSGWFPDNVVPLIQFDPGAGADPVQIAVTDRLRSDLEQAVDAAVQTGATQVSVEGLPRAMPVDVARGLLESFERAGADIRAGRPPKRSENGKKEGATGRRVGLKLKTNIDGLQYEERRAKLIGDGTDAAVLPKSLKATVALKPHQLEGVATLQRLYGHSPEQCRGALLADDMGLGKTLQLLTFLAAAFEQERDMRPALIVAPVSLLENWLEETEKFFEKGALPVLTVYGGTLAGLKADRSSIDAQLQRDGLVKFLRPGWRGDAKLVLTTYETLRDLEFSFAAEHWSVFVCDEAQKIKNPAAAVTRAAKKQHARFKIACTGTPVENTLTDLWCLFDFVQPGLLGSLNEFGRLYRKPIEAKTDAERQRVDALRHVIEPQVIRRTKKQVAKDLPAKIVGGDTKVPLSDHQRSLYAWALDSFRRRGDDEAAKSRPFKNHLGVLHFLRMVCADPRTASEQGLRLDPFEAYSKQSPKLGWLVGRLREIERRSEKVLVFCEFRDMQQMLAHYIAVNFGFMPDIINGDAPAAAKADASRQARLRVFQAKPGFGVIILSPLAVGFGVNIQAANHVVHFTRTWNPAKEDQATDRAYRIGQTKDVTVYYPTVYADDFDTFEVKLDRLLGSKRELADDMLNGAGDVRAEELL